MPASAKVARTIGFTAALSRVWYWSLLFGAYSVLPVLLFPNGLETPFDPAPIIDASLGITLGFFLVFRMNRAYERWWEARTLWGTLVNVSRNLAIKVKTLAEPDGMERARARTLIVGFAHGLKEHLRSGTTLREVPGFEKSEDDPKHVPAFLVEQIYVLFTAWRSAGKITGQDFWILDREARVFLDVTGGCERIKNTLMAQSFPALVRQALVLYLLYLPWSVIDEFGPFTIPLTVLVAYFMIGAEGVAHYVERPFGKEDDHLDLESICAGIDTTVTEILDR